MTRAAPRDSDGAQDAEPATASAGLPAAGRSTALRPAAEEPPQPLLQVVEQVVQIRGTGLPAPIAPRVTAAAAAVRLIPHHRIVSPRTRCRHRRGAA